MMRAILFDADGVVLKRHGYFSERYAQEYDIPLSQVTPFFTGVFGQCSLGKADLKEVIAPYLDQWGWGYDVDRFLKYWFEEESELDDAVLGAVRAFEKGNIPCFLVSDQEKYRADYLRNELGFRKEFTDMFFSCDLGVSKSNPEFFLKVLEKLALPANEVAYFDDDEKNVEVAKQLGIHGCYFQAFEDIQAFLNKAE